RFPLIFAAIVSIVALAAKSHAGQFFEDFSSYATGTTNFNNGAVLVSSAPSTVAMVVDATSKELQLTANGVNNTHSALFLPDLDAGQAVSAFSLKWNAEINGNFPNAADGFSVSFGQLAVRTNFQLIHYKY